MEYLNAFLCGGALCALGQLLIDKTKLTPAKILVCYVTAGVILSALGIYQYVADWGGAGAAVPLTGFGNTLVKGGAEGCGPAGASGRPHRGHHRHRRRNRRRHFLRLSGGPDFQGQAEALT